MEEQPEAYINEQGTKIWYLLSKGKHYYHRLDGPAAEWLDGWKHWYVNNKLHRLDGPAAVCGYENFWFINGKELPIKEVEEWMEENKIDLTTQAGQMAFKMRWT